MANVRILNTVIPRSAISSFRSLSRASEIEPIISPQFAESFRGWLQQVASLSAIRWPKRSGRSSVALAKSARVTGTYKLDNIHGYLLVSEAVMANEFGATILPKKSRKLAIPLEAALYPDGSPKRLGPKSWSSLGTFIYKSRKTGHSYVAYKSQRKGLVLLYLLVDKVQLKSKAIITSTYDMMLPQLEAEWTAILSEVIFEVYSREFDLIYAQLTNLKLPKLPPKPPDARMHAARLLPRRT